MDTESEKGGRDLKFLLTTYLLQTPKIAGKKPDRCLRSQLRAAIPTSSAASSILVPSPPSSPKPGGGGAEWAWEAAVGPGPADPFRADWKHW